MIDGLYSVSVEKSARQDVTSTYEPFLIQYNMDSETKSPVTGTKDEESMSVMYTNHSLQNDGQYKSFTSCYSHPQKTLKPWNTFRLEVYATRISVVETIDALCQCWKESYNQGQPTLLLGEGSNVLFIENFCGHVIINRIKGFQIDEQAGSWVLHVGAGEIWHHLVNYTLQNGMPGLENLALIPGCVGAAPIQNIGAYGVEFAKFCDYVDVFCLSDSKIRRLLAEECEFGYRDSIFKRSYREGYAIVAVGLRLPKIWQPELSYGNLNTLNPLTVTPQQVFDLVCVMRKEKLPDPNEIGNAGSFFKNPIVSAETAKGLKLNFPLMPEYYQESGEVKLAAGWLIDQCDLKGFRIGDAAVHDKQALVLTNASAATSSDVIDLARKVRQRVADKFNVWLEPEVRFIGSHGETDAVKVISIEYNGNT